jgi:response regulator NasT
MKDRFMTMSFEGFRALVLHRPHPNTVALEKQFLRIGVNIVAAWPDFPAGYAATDFDIVLFDADNGFDEQFPWPPGDAPVPTIALIGSEAPGRITWAISHGADAQMLKPIGSSGVYSAMVSASCAFARRKDLEQRVSKLEERLSNRENLAEATAILMVRRHMQAREAYALLRKQAMSEQRTLDDVAQSVIDEMNSQIAKSKPR